SRLPRRRAASPPAEKRTALAPSRSFGRLAREIETQSAAWTLRKSVNRGGESVVFENECGRGRQLFDDLGIQPGVGVFCRHAERFFDGPLAAGSVANDADAVDAQQRRAAISAVVVLVNQGLQSMHCFDLVRFQTLYDIGSDHFHDEF